MGLHRWANRRSLFYGLVAGILTADAIVLHYLLHHYDPPAIFRATPPPEEEHVHLNYGEAFPSLSGTSATGKPIDSEFLRGKWGVVFYFKDHPMVDFLSYCDVLNRKYHSLGLQPLGITRRKTEELKQFLNRRAISYPILLDPGDRLRDLLHLEHHSYGFFFVNPDGVIEFSLHRLMTSNDLRQLVEWHLVGRINYEIEKEWHLGIRPGDALPPYKIIDVKTGAALTLHDLDLTGSVIIFFTANCSTCQMSNYLEELKAMETSGVWSQNGVHYIFSQNFSLFDLIDRLNAHHIVANIYLAKEPFDVLESPYVTRAPLSEEALALTIDTQGRVKTVEPLAQWLARISKESVR